MERIIDTCTQLILVLLIGFTLVSCDPGQTIRIENKTQDKASIIFVFKKGSQYYRFEELNQADTLVVQLDNTPNNSFKEYHFGIGTWEIANSMDSLVTMVEYIEVVTRGLKKYLKDRSKLGGFLKVGFPEGIRKR